MPGKKPKMPKLTYFFYRGDLHKKLHINRADDVVTAWNYPQAKVMKYIYSDVRKNGEKAFRTSQVSEMISRSPLAVKRAIYSESINPPQMTYTLDERRYPLAYYWSEEDIMELHSYFKTVHRGRPRNDGRATPQSMPSASELRAMIRQGTVYYVEVDGKFVPTWDAHNV